MIMMIMMIIIITIIITTIIMIMMMIMADISSGTEPGYATRIDTPPPINAYSVYLN